MQSAEIKQILDIRKREFVKYSKQFSNTLKAYFRQGQYVSCCFQSISLDFIRD